MISSSIIKKVLNAMSRHATREFRNAEPNLSAIVAEYSRKKADRIVSIAVNHTPRSLAEEIEKLAIEVATLSHLATLTWYDEFWLSHQNLRDVPAESNEEFARFLAGTLDDEVYENSSGSLAEAAKEAKKNAQPDVRELTSGDGKKTRNLEDDGDVL